jgi:hypothetical protein
MARLPIQGGDDGVWGTILNDYLSQVHAADGTLKAGTVTDTTVAAAANIAQSKVANLTTDLAGKAPTVHTHAEYARLDGASFTGEVRLQEYTETVTSPAVAATTTLNCVNGMTHRITLTQNTTIAITGLSPTANLAQTVSIFMKQDATGGRTVTWPSGVKWSNGVAPTLVTTANAENVVSLTTFDSGTTWYGFPAGTDMR